MPTPPATVPWPATQISSLSGKMPTPTSPLPAGQSGVREVAVAGKLSTRSCVAGRHLLRTRDYTQIPDSSLLRGEGGGSALGRNDKPLFGNDKPERA